MPHSKLLHSPHMIDLGKTEVLEPVIAHLLHRIYRYRQTQMEARVWGWLFVHGLEEGCSFELAMGTAPIETEELLQSEIWQYDTEMDEADEAVGEYELVGVLDGYDLANDRPWTQRPSLHFQGWTLSPTGNYEWDCQGFDVGEEDEAEHIFIARVYRYILQQTIVRAPKNIEGFVLEMHDSTLPREWIGQVDIKNL